MCELIDEAIVGLCFEIHRSIKNGVYSILEQSDEKMQVLYCNLLKHFRYALLTYGNMPV